MQVVAKRQKITNYTLFEDPRLHLNHIVEIAKNLDDKTLWSFCVSSSRFRKICQEVPELKQRYLKYIQCSHRKAALRRMFDFLNDLILSHEWRRFLSDPSSERMSYQRSVTVDAKRSNSNVDESQIEVIFNNGGVVKWTFVFDENQCPDYYRIAIEFPIDLSNWAKTGRINTFYSYKGRKELGKFTSIRDEATGTKWTNLLDMNRELSE